MTVPKVCVLRAPGTNCDVETAHAFDLCGGSAERMHLFRLLENPERLMNSQILCVPGGFSYGDDIGAGVIFSRHLQTRLGEVLREFLEGDRLVLGICNGFQVLLKAGLLPDWQTGWPPKGDTQRDVTLTWNENGRYTARWVHCETVGERCVFLKGIDRIDLPIAHAEGRIALTDPEAVDRWTANGQIALRYVEPNPSGPGGESVMQSDPVNPNGSVGGIAGLCDPTGRVFGLMPHPERYLFGTQHPLWTRLEPGTVPDTGAGRTMFQNAIDYFA